MLQVAFGGPAPTQDLQELAKLMYVIQNYLSRSVAASSVIAWAVCLNFSLTSDPSEEKKQLRQLPATYVAQVDELLEEITRKANSVQVQIDDLLDRVNVGLCRHRAVVIYEVIKAAPIS